MHNRKWYQTYFKISCKDNFNQPCSIIGSTRIRYISLRIKGNWPHLTIRQAKTLVKNLNKCIDEAEKREKARKEYIVKLRRSLK